MAPPLTQVLALMVQHGAVPNALSGATAVPVLKKGKQATLTTAHRPIQLLTVERKIAGKVLLQELMRHLSHDTHQFCSRQSGGVSTPHFLLSQTQQHAMNTHKHHSLIFIDVTAAFDNIIRQLILPPDNNTRLLMSTLRRLGLTTSQSTSTLQYIREHPMSLVNLQLPPFLTATLRSWVHGPWLATPATTRVQHQQLHNVPQPRRPFHFHVTTPSTHSERPSSTMATTKGILQGDPLSTCLFVLTYQVAIDMALERVFHDSEHHYDQFLQLPVPTGRDLTAVHSREVEVLTHITYADDLVFPVLSDTPEQLLKSTVAIVKHLQDAFNDFGLDVNTNKEKSEILLRITGKASKGIYQFLHQCDHMNAPIDDDQLSWICT
eukprot:3233062-Amphidinium_carterae.1